AGRVHQGARSPVGSGSAALSEAPRVRAHEAAREIWRRGAGDRTNSRVPARKYLGPGLVEHLSARRAEERRPWILARRHFETAQDAAARHGARRRALLLVARF